jgi:multicomponent Na+:H+ antiporter subunit C
MTAYLAIALVVVGVWGLIRQRNLIKKIIALNILNSALVILFIYRASLTGTTAPILDESRLGVVDPLPQALMLTGIVIGVCVTALALTLIVRAYRLTGTLDIDLMMHPSRESDE